MSKIGIGIVTCNRNNFLKKCIQSIKKDWYDELVIVNDGTKPLDVEYTDVINNPTNLGVCKSKNILLKHLLGSGCEYIFIVLFNVR